MSLAVGLGGGGDRAGHQAQGDGENRQRATALTHPSTLLSVGRGAVVVGTRERALHLLPYLENGFLLPSPKGFGNHRPRVVFCVRTMVLEGSHRAPGKALSFPLCRDAP